MTHIRETRPGGGPRAGRRSRAALVAAATTACLAAVAVALPAQAPGPSQALVMAGAQRAPALAAPMVRELPGGGTRIFPGNNYVALYGHPGTPALGVLGEQRPRATIRRVKDLAARYERHTRRDIVPALEIIATIATAAAGADGDYSAESSVAELRPLVRAAGRRGVYVVLDLQPGRSTFFRQAKLYKALLRKAHVGLALDPEWRLKPWQVHLRQIGSVDASEINRVARWLANFTAARGLPQKMLLLHQFRTSMIRNRSTLDTSRPELAMAIQMDGLGTQPAKQTTWDALRVDAPAGIKFGWKNFIDEDRPMLSPKGTMAVRPQPRWVSYQ